MNQLIAIQSAAIGTDAIPTCNARDLHAFLQVQTQFKDWIARRIEEYEFEEGKDFCSILSESTGGRPAKEYALSLDMAKELSMVERTEKGKQARQYFIECERQAKTGGQAKIAKPSQQITEAAKVFKANFSIMRLIGCDKNAAAISANQATQKTIGINLLALNDKTHLEAANQDSAHYIPTKIGEHIGGLSAQAVNKRLAEAGLQERIAGEWEATPAGKPHSRRVDTAMRHSDGRPVSQLLWALSVIPLIQPEHNQRSNQA